VRIKGLEVVIVPSGRRSAVEVEVDVQRACPWPKIASQAPRRRFAGSNARCASGSSCHTERVGVSGPQNEAFRMHDAGLWGIEMVLGLTGMNRNQATNLIVSFRRWGRPAQTPDESGRAGLIT
jgi:hypothetical protein